MRSGEAKTVFRSLGVDLAGSRAMTILADEPVPDELWALVEPLLSVLGQVGAASLAGGAVAVVVGRYNDGGWIGLGSAGCWRG